MKVNIPLVLFILLLTACGGPGEVIIKEGAKTYIPVPGLEVHEALQRLKLAQDDSSFLSEIEKLRATAAETFDWSIFWQGLSEFDLSFVNDSTLSKTAGLHGLSCDRERSKDHFLNYSNWSLKQKNGWKFLTDQFRKCKFALGKETTLRVVQGMAIHQQGLVEAGEIQEAENFSVQIVSMTIKEYVSDPRGNWTALFRPESRVNWNRVFQDLIKKNKSQDLIMVIRIQRLSSNDSTPKTLVYLVESIVTDLKMFRQLVKSIGLLSVLNILAEYPDFKYRDMSRRALDRLHAEIYQSLKPNEVRGISIDRLTIIWERLLRVHVINRKFEGLIGYRRLLKRHEVTMREIESLIQSYPVAAYRFFKYRYESHPDAFWLNYRLIKQNTSKIPYDDQDLAFPGYPEEKSWSFTDQAAIHRIRIHSEKNPATKRIQIAQFCKFLNHKGGLRQKISIQKFKSNPSVINQTGCHEIEIPESEFGKTIKINIPSLKQSFNTVVLFSGANLEINTNYLDGGIFDLSSDYVYPTLNEELGERSELSQTLVAIPVLLGIKTDGGHPLFKKGEHYFWVHLNYPIQPVRNILPKFGKPGGNLTIHVQKANHVFTPSFVGKSGLGQEGLEASQVVIDSAAAKQWLGGLNSSRPLGSKSHYHENPKVSWVRELLKSAKRDQTKKRQIEFVINQDYIKEFLTQITQNQIHRICKNQPNLKACLKTLIGLNAVKRIETLVYTGSNYTNSGELLPVLRSKQYQVSKEDLPTVNMKAKSGKVGQLKIRYKN